MGVSTDLALIIAILLVAGLLLFVMARLEQTLDHPPRRSRWRRRWSRGRS